MKVFVNGFWDGFTENTDPNKWFFFKYLFNQIFNEPITLGNLHESNILLESVFSDKTFINFKKWNYTFFFNGESMNFLFDKKYPRFREIANYDCILSGRYNNFDNKIINLPLFISYIYYNNYLPILQNTPIVTNIPKKNICAIISNGNSIKRNYFLDKLESKVHIDYAGKFRNNVERIEGTYNSDKILNFYSEYKFIIALENTKQETYITEKIINGFLSKTIPIYWGSNSITDYFNEDRFINIPNLNDSSINIAIDKIISIINNDEEYLRIVNEPIFKNNELTRNVFDISNDIKKLLLGSSL